MAEMGAAFLARTAEGVRCYFTDEGTMKFLTSHGCQIRLDPRVDPKASAMDVLDQGVEKGLIVPGSIFPIGLQQEQYLINFCQDWAIRNGLNLEECVALLDSVYQELSRLVSTMLYYYCHHNRKDFVWIDDEHPEGHSLPDLISLWSAKHPDQEFSYAKFYSDTELGVIGQLS